jgi:SET domain-containing protein
MDETTKKWGHRWVTPKAKEQDSKIDRKGLVATERISAGEPVVVYGGIIIPKDDLTEYRALVGDYDVPFDEDFSIAPTSREEAIAVVSINHSCEPTLGWKSPIMLVAIKDVEPGEELTVEYAMHGCYPEEMKCGCGTPSCRKTIRPDDWKDPEIQAKYGKWFMPRIKEKF